MDDYDKQIETIRAAGNEIMARAGGRYTDVGGRMIVAWLAFYGGPGTRKYRDVPRHRMPALLKTLQASLDDLFCEPPTLDDVRAEAELTLEACGANGVINAMAECAPGARKYMHVPPSMRAELIAAFRSQREKAKPAA